MGQWRFRAIRFAVSFVAWVLVPRTYPVTPNAMATIQATGFDMMMLFSLVRLTAAATAAGWWS